MNDSVKNHDVISGSCVLYIEDNDANIRLMKDIFSEFLDYELISANNARQGIDMIQQYAPSLVLMDINMDEMNGYQALELIQSDDRISSTPVIAISADAMAEQIEKGFEKGFVDYIPKPFNVAKLIETIKSHLEKKASV